MRTIILKPILIFVCSVICALYLWTQTHPATATEPSSPAAITCKTDITWVKQGENHWQSETGITLKLYRDPRFNEVPSTRFWDGKQTPRLENPLQNLADAYTLLAEALPGEEIDVTQQFRRIVNPWDTSNLPLNDPDQPLFIPLSSGRILQQSSPYKVHYLQRHADNWVIDRLFVHAQGIFNKEKEFQYVYVVERGPFLPVFEGRFKQGGFQQPDGITFWFSTYDPAIHRRLSDSDMQSRSPSTPEMRLATWQAINSFFCSLYQK